MITWGPIAELPDELKDGRQVLLWDKDEPQGYEAVVATFSSLEGGLGGWHNDEFVPIVGHTHFAEINAPESPIWRPMETAPKDGTRIIGRVGDEPTVVYWDADESEIIGGPKTGAWVLTATDTHAFNAVEYPEAWIPLAVPA